MKKSLLFTTVLFVMIVSGLSVGLNYQIQFVVDAISNHDTTSFFKQISYLIGITLLLLVFEYARQVLNVKYLNQVGSFFHKKSLYSAIASAVQVQSEKQLVPGEKVSEINNDIEMIKDLHYDTQISMIQGIVSFLFSTIALYMIHAGVATAVIVTMFLPIGLPLLFNKSLQQKQEKISRSKKQYVTFLTDLLESKLAVKNSRHYPLVMKKAVEKYETMNEATLSKKKQIALVNILVGFGFYATMIVILLLGGYQVLIGQLQIGALVAVFSISQELTLPANLIADSISNLQSVKGIHDELMHQESALEERANQVETLKTLQLKDVKIHFQHQTFTQNVPLNFEKGKKYLITGQSGKGKSLLMLVATGNFRDYKGTVLFNQRPIENVPYSTIQQQIAYIPQQEGLFHDTIRNNLTYYSGEVDTHTLMEWIHRFRLEDRFPTLESLEELYSEQSSLSGGQIQRLMLIRALLERKDWLILDESLSALDRELYELIENQLLNDSALTLIHISHRSESENSKRYDVTIRL